MNKNIDRRRVICELYKDGHTISQIARELDSTSSEITRYVQQWYKSIYHEDPETCVERREKKLKDLYNRYCELYVPFKYSRKQMINLLGCTVFEFDTMLEKYNLHHLRMNTSKGMMTLCNVPKDVFEEYKEYAKQHNMSVRKFAMIAINEYLLKQMK